MTGVYKPPALSRGFDQPRAGELQLHSQDTGTVGVKHVVEHIKTFQFSEVLLSFFSTVQHEPTKHLNSGHGAELAHELERTPPGLEGLLGIGPRSGSMRAALASKQKSSNCSSCMSCLMKGDTAEGMMSGSGAKRTVAVTGMLGSYSLSVAGSCFTSLPWRTRVCQGAVWAHTLHRPTGKESFGFTKHR